MKQYLKEVARVAGWPLAAILYLSFSGFFCLLLLVAAWPEGRLTDLHYGGGNRQEALKAVLQHRLTVLSEISEGIHRAKLSSPKLFSSKVRQTYTRERHLIDALLNTNALLLTSPAEFTSQGVRPLEEAVDHERQKAEMALAMATAGGTRLKGVGLGPDREQVIFNVTIESQPVTNPAGASPITNRIGINGEPTNRVVFERNASTNMPPARTDRAEDHSGGIFSRMWNWLGPRPDDRLDLLLPAELPNYAARLDVIRKTTPPYFLGAQEIAIMAVIMALGALGACIQGVSSVAIYVGMMKFRARWMLFYFSRPFVGAGVALGFYMVMKVGLVAPVSKTQVTPEVNLAWASAIAMLVGLFSGEAMEKLREVASAVFRSNQKTDSTEDADFIIKTTAKNAGQLSIYGIGFTAEQVLLINNQQVPFTFVNPGQIDVTITPALAMSFPLELMLVETRTPVKFSNKVLA